MYYDVDTDEIYTPEGVGEVIPQEGTTLSLDVTYEYDYYTKFEPGYEFRVYRYHVLVNDWEYSSGVVWTENQKVSIPIMANDTHTPATIVVEGAKAMDYSDYPSSWDSWHQLYQGTQESLPESESPRFAGLEDAKLKMEISGKTFSFDIEDSGSGIAFKRIMSSLGQISVPVTIETFITISPWDFPVQIAQTVPVNQDATGAEWKAGNIYFEGGDLYICLKDKKVQFLYPTLIGHVAGKDLKALKALYPGWQRQDQADITLYLE
ncbi:MAG: hypothetical protein K6A64_01710 [Bacteroidales bacterium]|nr:hypothetical protein [Bacteroidales bacterium]